MKAGEDTARLLLAEIAQDIASLHADLKELAPQEITSQRIPAAGEELEAVVAATESATHDIMLAAEEILETSAQVGGDFGEKVEASATRIFEACTFQDITGQRIGKVIKTLKLIEDRLTASGIVRLAQSMSADSQGTASTAESDDPPLEGPALKDKDGLKQNDIDSLLNDLF